MGFVAFRRNSHSIAAIGGSDWIFRVVLHHAKCGNELKQKHGTRKFGTRGVKKSYDLRAFGISSSSAYFLS